MTAFNSVCEQFSDTKRLISSFLNPTQNKFKEIPIVLVTAEHLRTGKEYDASLIWTEDPSKDSFQVCLREMQNFDGKHEDINVVCTRFNISKIILVLKVNKILVPSARLQPRKKVVCPYNVTYIG